MFGYNTNKRSYLWEAINMHMQIGQTVEIVYLDKVGKLSQRKIEVKGIKDGKIRATCLTTGAPRVFLTTNILAWQSSKKGAIA